jgi:uncharacterized protein (DUF697 family)
MVPAKQKIHEIIHDASDACDGVDGDSAIAPIQVSMILALASEYGIEMNNAAATELLQKLTATVRSRQVHFSRQALVGWLPGIDNPENDSTAAALTEAIGWAANSHFEKNEAK